MIGQEDPEFFRRRAREERGKADRATDSGARLAHRKLAELYDMRTGEGLQAEHPVA